MSHLWYRVEDVPPTARYKMPDGKIIIELRADDHQTVIPPSTHTSGEAYRWEGTAWGGKKGPAQIDGRKLSVQVALLALGAVLIDNWPAQGSRHEAYLALAGGLLRFGTTVHPRWEANLPALIRAIADVTHDSDGAETRVSEVMGSTVERLRSGSAVTGFPRLAEFIGNDHAEQARRLAREVENLAGWTASLATMPQPDQAATFDLAREIAEQEAIVSTLPPDQRNPLTERTGSWQPVDLEPYLLGEVHSPAPKVLRREDGHGLFYEGRVNSLYGQSEAAKSWVALIACAQEMQVGQRVMYLDFEDEPTFTLERLQHLGVGSDDVRALFTYVRPEDPIAPMQRNRFGGDTVSDVGRKNDALFKAALEKVKPSLVVVDGMTVLYGLHGLDTNDATSTDIITSWLKSLCRNGLTTVIVIDHTGKTAGPGTSPIGAHHKIAMVQGTALQAHPQRQPMRGALGEVMLYVYKDRPGKVRQIASREKPARAALVTLDSREEGMTRWSVQVPPKVVQDEREGQIAACIVAALREHHDLPKAQRSDGKGDRGLGEIAPDYWKPDDGDPPMRDEVTAVVDSMVKDGRLRPDIDTNGRQKGFPSYGRYILASAETTQEIARREATR